MATGFDYFDRLTDGLQFREQTIIAARPSIGKSAIGLNIVEQACLKAGTPTLFISCEMSPPALVKRLLASHLNIPMGVLRSGKWAERAAPWGMLRS